MTLTAFILLVLCILLIVLAVLITSAHITNTLDKTNWQNRILLVFAAALVLQVALNITYIITQ